MTLPVDEDLELLSELEAEEREARNREALDRLSLEVLSQVPPQYLPGLDPLPSSWGRRYTGGLVWLPIRLLRKLRHPLLGRLRNG